MYSFKIREAEMAIRGYLRKHPNSKAATQALNGDCAAMIELYEKLCGPIEQVVEEGPSNDAAMIISEAIICKYPPAMVRFAQDTMCLGDNCFTKGLMMLLDAYKLGSQEAMTQLKNDWHNGVKDIDARRKVGDRLNKYKEFIIAFYYHYGIEVEKNESLALRLFQSSAKHGCEAAQKLLQNIQNDDARQVK